MTGKIYSPLGQKHHYTPVAHVSNALFVWLKKRLSSIVIGILLIIIIKDNFSLATTDDDLTVVVAITPTHKRPERLADMTRLAQTLMHVKKLHWIVVEDGPFTFDHVERLLNRTGLKYSYITAVTPPGISRRGWSQRNAALDFIRQEYKDFKGEAVMYFADDDNAFDIRLFNDYIRNVKTIGLWAVGLGSGSLVESPHVENGVVTSWDVMFDPSRKFGVDMAGFGVNVKLILAKNVSFHKGCTKTTPENCFLMQFGLDKSEMQPFGWNDIPRDILVWHIKSHNIGTRGGDNGYIAELY